MGGITGFTKTMRAAGREGQPFPTGRSGKGPVLLRRCSSLPRLSAGFVCVSCARTGCLSISLIAPRYPSIV